MSRAKCLLSTSKLHVSKKGLYSRRHSTLAARKVSEHHVFYCASYGKLVHLLSSAVTASSSVARGTALYQALCARCAHSVSDVDALEANAALPCRTVLTETHDQMLWHKPCGLGPAYTAAAPVVVPVVVAPRLVPTPPLTRGCSSKAVVPRKMMRSRSKMAHRNAPTK